MPAASYKKDMVGRTRISDRLDIEYLPEIRFLGIALRFSQKMCKAVRHHVLWPTFWAYFCWFFKCCFASLLHHFENTNLLLKTIQYFRKPRFGVLTRSIINYKYDFEMRKKKRSEMANFYMTWWCVCVYIWFSMHFMPRDLFSEPMNCQLGNSKGMNENEIALFTILRKVWSEKKSTLQNHQVYCTYFNGNTRPNLILMLNGWIVIQNICK